MNAVFYRSFFELIFDLKIETRLRRTNVSLACCLLSKIYSLLQIISIFSDRSTTSIRFLRNLKDLPSNITNGLIPNQSHQIFRFLTLFPPFRIFPLIEILKTFSVDRCQRIFNEERVSSSVAVSSSICKDCKISGKIPISKNVQCTLNS